MWELLIAVVTSVCTLIGVIVTAVFNNKKLKETNQKVSESSDLTLYRIKELEKKQDKHNSLIERVFNLEERLTLEEERLKVANHRIEDLEHKAS